MSTRPVVSAHLDTSFFIVMYYLIDLRNLGLITVFCFNGMNTNFESSRLSYSRL